MPISCIDCLRYFVPSPPALLCELLFSCFLLLKEKEHRSNKFSAWTSSMGFISWPRTSREPAFILAEILKILHESRSLERDHWNSVKVVKVCYQHNKTDHLSLLKKKLKTILWKGHTQIGLLLIWHKELDLRNSCELFLNFFPCGTDVKLRGITRACFLLAGGFENINKSPLPPALFTK